MKFTLAERVDGVTVNPNTGVCKVTVLVSDSRGGLALSKTTFFNTASPAAASPAAAPWARLGRKRAK